MDNTHDSLLLYHWQVAAYRHALVQHAMCVEETTRAWARVRRARAVWKIARRWRILPKGEGRVGGASIRRLSRDFSLAVRAYQRATAAQADACDRVIEEAI